MLLYPITLLVLFPVVALSYDRLAHFRNRRVPVAQSAFGATVQPKKSLPFVIRVPYSKIVPSNALFSHSVSWKAKQTTATMTPSPPPPPAPADAALTKSADDVSSSIANANLPEASAQTPPSPPPLPDLEVSQFHAQDTNGQVVFGFNAPDQMRIEQRNADGTVHGTYSYLDPYGQIIKRQYWDTGAGFHVTDDSYPFNDASVNVGSGDAIVQYTPEVQAARDLHFQLYQQALASFLPNANSHRNDIRRNSSVPISEHGDDDNLFRKSNDSTTASTSAAAAAAAVSFNNDALDSTNSSSSSATVVLAAPMATETTLIRLMHSNESFVNANKGTVNIVEPDTENGSIVIQKPEYLRISWTTENKRYPVKSAASANDGSNPSQTQNNDNSKRSRRWGSK